MLLGIGGDGHILSLHPGCRDITAPRALVVGIKDPPMNPALSRISMTPALLEAARAVVVLAHGAAKATALAAMLNGPDDPMRTPAQLVRRAKGTVAILADQTAAAGLKRA
jgi:6-phosphogluconolactonase